MSLIAKISFNHIKGQLRQAGLNQVIIENDDFQFHFYDSQANKPVLMLLNGFGISTEFQWYKVVKALSKKYRIILVNLLAFGQSFPKPQKVASIDLQVAFLNQLLELLNIKEIKLAGISYGGLVGLEFVEKFESKVSELFLINSPVKYLDLEKLQVLCEKYGASNLKDFFAPKTGSGLSKQFQAAYYKTPTIPSFILNAFHTAFCLPYLIKWRQIIDSLLDNYDVLSKKTYTFPNPIKLIWGLEDEIIPFSIAEKLHAEMPNTTLFSIEKAGH